MHMHPLPATLALLLLAASSRLAGATVDLPLPLPPVQVPGFVTDAVAVLHETVPFHLHLYPISNWLQQTDTGDSTPRPQFCQYCKCGVANRATRIVGGRPTLVNEFPWVAALVRSGRVFCGATLVNNKFLLTAAHCVQGSPLVFRMNTLVVLAEHNTAVMTETVTDTRRLSAVFVHPDFRPERGTYDGDLALLEMSRPVRFRPELSPACLPQADEDFSGFTGTVAGWGRVSEKGQQAAELQTVEVPILSRQQCLRDTPYRPSRLTVNMMCAGPLAGGTDSCQGDSGGALLVEDENARLVTVGVVSWGEGCGRPGRPGVYTRVNHYLPWIQSITKDACYCT